MARRKKKKNRSPLLLSSLVLLICLLLAGTGLMLRERAVRQREQALYEELTRIRELVTSRQTYRSVFYTRIKENFIQERTLLFTADFHVAAGIDLSRGFSLRSTGRRVSLILPTAEILFIDADDTTLEQVLILERFSSVTTGDYLTLLTEEKENILRQGVEGGIEKQAEQRAGQIFRGMLKLAGYERVNISFRKELL
jgi:hypothetical protein